MHTSASPAVWHRQQRQRRSQQRAAAKFHEFSAVQFHRIFRLTGFDSKFMIGMASDSMEYVIRKKVTPTAPTANWEDTAWQRAETLAVNNFRPESSDHRPIVSARLLHDTTGIHGIFAVQDRFVRCVRTEYGSPVCRDSCVEFFAEPKPDRGYFNFEFNCGGTFLCWHITDPTRTPDGFKQFVRVPWDKARAVRVQASLPRIVEPEITESLAWTLRFFIPFALLEGFVGPLGEIAGQAWRGNFFKCGDETSHPHWASWSPVDELNFHLPRCFGRIRFK